MIRIVKAAVALALTVSAAALMVGCGSHPQTSSEPVQQAPVANVQPPTADANPLAGVIDSTFLHQIRVDPNINTDHLTDEEIINYGKTFCERFVATDNLRSTIIATNMAETNDEGQIAFLAVNAYCPDSYDDFANQVHGL